MVRSPWGSRFKHGAFVLLLAAAILLQIVPPAHGAECDPPEAGRVEFETYLREHNAGLRVAFEVTGQHARDLRDIFNALPPPSDIQSDLSVLYTADRRDAFWVLFFEGCAVANMVLPPRMVPRLFGEIGLRL